MALFFSSGGGRLGNQILNLIHLIAISLDDDFDVLKINDSFLTSNDGSIMFKVNENKSKWSVDYRTSKEKIFNHLFLKIFIRLIHLFFYLAPKFRSYKVGSKNDYPRLIFAKKLGKNFSLIKLKEESKKYNVVLSGWGLRDWGMVVKHKETVRRKLISGFKELMMNENSQYNDYIFVHIRRGDFIEVDEYKILNYDDQVWIKSIKKLCSEKRISKVVIFSDSIISKFFISSLESKNLEVFLPEISCRDTNFLKLFFSYLYGGSFVLCNASSLVLSIAFLKHEIIYLPSIEKSYVSILLDAAHNTFPTDLNWN